MYSRPTGIAIGFHGCDISTAEKVLSGKARLTPSSNDFDWLGPGIYFWENDPERALKYAALLRDNPRRGIAKITEPYALGAVIDLGYCLNLVNSRSLEIVKQGYEMLCEMSKASGIPLPENRKPIGEENDLLLRRLDCAVINTIHTFNSARKMTPYDSVRGVFWEGKDLYPNAGFKERNHIQISVVNPNCIKGYFRPLTLVDGFSNP